MAMPTMQRFRLRASSITLAAAILAVPLLSAAAETGDAQRCQANKLRAAGAEVRARLACEADEIATGATAACTNAAKKRRDDAFTRFEERGACETHGDSGDVATEIDGFIAIVLSSLRTGGPAASQCTAAQLALVGRAVRKLTAAYALDLRRPDPEGLAARIESLEEKFGRAFARAGLYGDCLTTSAADVIWDIVARGAADLRDLLSPTCPCWTTESLDAAFPPGFFDENGRGGLLCHDGEVIGVSSASTCSLPLPGGSPFTLPRVSAVVVESRSCVFGELAPADAGTCAPPDIVDVTQQEADECVAELMASHVVDECP